MSKTAAWKQHERRTAARLSGVRSPNTGKQTADVSTPLFAIECKARKEVPKWLTDAMNQAKRNAGDGQTGIVVLHQHGTRSDRDLVLMSMSDFQGWAGSINANNEGSEEP